MKKSIMLLMALLVGTISLLSLSSFTTVNLIPIKNTSLAKFDQPESVQFTFNRNPLKTLQARGAINADGKWSMQVRSTGKAFHCINTMTFPGGVIVAISNCNSVTMNGVWHIISASGDYAGMEGNGSLVMGPTGELWEGSIRN